MKTQVLLQVAIFRFGVRRFERQLNDLLEAGWRLDGRIVVHKGLLRMLFVAVLNKG